MKELVESIARALVDHPEDVQDTVEDETQGAVLELRVHTEDLGKVIGRQGRQGQGHSHVARGQRQQSPQTLHPRNPRRLNL